MELKDLLVYLSGVGVVGAVSWVIEYFGLFGDMESKKKQLAFFGICAVVALGAWGISTYAPVAVLNAITVPFGILATLFSYVFLGDFFHKTTKLDAKDS